MPFQLRLLVGLLALLALLAARHLHQRATLMGSVVPAPGAVGAGAQRRATGFSRAAQPTSAAHSAPLFFIRTL